MAVDSREVEEALRVADAVWHATFPDVERAAARSEWWTTATDAPGSVAHAATRDATRNAIQAATRAATRPTKTEGERR